MGECRKAQVNKTWDIYRGKSFAITVEDVTLPNDARTDYVMVRHPGSVGIVPIMSDDTVLMTFQYRHVIGEYILEIPSGTMEKGESPVACAMRELEEETGFAAEEITQIAAVHIIPAYSDELMHIFIAKGLTPTSQKLDPDEIIQIRKHPYEELIRYIEEGKITDGLTILSLFLARRHCRGG
jgi:ADP-ribose pyrophosphatase